jgi:hypothetical protein
MNLDFSKKYVIKNKIYDFMMDAKTIKFHNNEVRIEDDYAWDYRIDPIITPTIIHEWKYLDLLMSHHVLRDANAVLSIGGGGSSRTHEYLSTKTKEFAILNTGKWDLENAQVPKSEIKTYLIRSVGEEIPITDSQIQAIEIPSTLDHVVDAKKVVEESFRVLSNGGLIGITLGNSESWYRKLINLLRIPIVDNHEHHHNFHFRVIDVERMLLSAGFTEIRTIGTAYFKLPKRIERNIKSPILLSVHRFISNSVLRRVFGDQKGGMFLTIASKPTTYPNSA